ncbi:MAG: hypothetical protein GX896_10295 [Clostridiales bacterium]|nr:hypothetical protein [Clostridiales bacterium]
MTTITVKDSLGEELQVLTQWDTGRECYINGEGFENSPQVHFCNKKSGEAFRVTTEHDDENGRYKVKIPNILLTQPYDITGYVYHLGEENKTIETFHLCVTPRKKPDDYNYVENIDIVTADKISNDLQNILNIYAKKLEGRLYEGEFPIKLSGLDYITTEVNDAIKKIYDITFSANEINKSVERIQEINPITTLYQGAWTTGNVSMSSDARKYKMFGIRTSSNGGKMLAHRIDNVIRGIGGHCTGSTIEIFTFSASVFSSSANFEVWTKVAFGYATISSSGSISNTIEGVNTSSKAGVYQIEGLM